MAEEIVSKDQEQQMKKLKRLLESWRMAVLPLKSALLWEEQWHPAAIFIAISFIHLFIWLLDMNFLTTFAVVGLIINFVDFIVPVICNSVCSPNSWTGQKEKCFEDTCRIIVTNYNKVIQNIKSFYNLRETSPCMYYIISISAMIGLAWISASVNNILLLYIFTTGIVMYPGLCHRGLLKTFLPCIFSKAKSLKSE